MSISKKSAENDFRKNDFHNPFTLLFNGKIVFVGIGNSMRGDDGLGPAFVKQLKNKVDFQCINGGDVPENYFGKIVNEHPDTVIFIDAVQLFLEPGEYRVLQHDDLLNAGFSTHSASPSILMEYLGRETGAKVYMLGVQPNSVIFGGELSVSVKRTLARLDKLILEALET